MAYIKIWYKIDLWRPKDLEKAFVSFPAVWFEIKEHFQT